MTFFITEFTKFIKRNNLVDFVIVIKFDLTLNLFNSNIR